MAPSASRSRRTRRSAAAPSTSTSPRFGAVCAYTLDGGTAASSNTKASRPTPCTVTFNGFNTHPGYAKGRMVNAIKAAAAFVDRLPADALSPETTDGYEGFVHPYACRPASTARRCGCSSAISRRRARRTRKRSRVARTPGGGPSPGSAARDRGRRAVSEHARGARSAPAVVECAREAIRRAGLSRPRTSDPRRHGRIAAVVHGPAHAESVRRRAQLPLAARVGVGAGHGKGRRRHRRARAVWEEGSL